MIFWGVVTAIMTAAGTMLLFIEPFGLTTIVLIFLTAFFPLFLFLIMTAKIKLGHDFIERRILFKTTRIELTDVKSYGIFSIVGSFASIIEDPNDFDKNEFMPNRWVFITKGLDFNPNRISKTDSIQFQYRPELYQKVKEIIKKSQHTT